MSSLPPLHHNLIIIGAGAHVPYKFPTSQGLTAIVKKIYGERGKVSFLTGNQKNHTSIELRYKHELCELAKKLNFVVPPEKPTSVNEHDILIGNSLESFLRSFCESSVYSIDTYLNKIAHGQVSDDLKSKSNWGRLIVAYLISEHERQMPFGTQEFDWIQFLINRYIEKDHNVFFQNPPKIITFNYDRYFERSLYKHLTEHHQLSEDEAKEKVDSLPIVHVYGRLGCFTSWDDFEPKAFFEEAIDNIQVIGEQRSKDRMAQVSSKIRDFINNCSKVYFLGYGFDSQNNKLLQTGLAKDWHQYVDTYSTNVGIQKSDQMSIAQNLKFLPKYLNRTTSPVDVCSLDLLKDLAPLEKERSEPPSLLNGLDVMRR